MRPGHSMACATTLLVDFRPCAPPTFGEARPKSAKPESELRRGISVRDSLD